MPTHDFLLPDLGEGLEDAEIVEWRVKVGDTVAVDQPLVEVETAKANVELPSPYAGTVVALHGAPGDRVLVGAPLASFEVLDDGEARARPPERPLVGFGVTATATATTDAHAPRSASAAVLAPEAGGGRAKAAPPVRKRARELGIDLERVQGSGPSGVVTRADLDRFVGTSAVPPGSSGDADTTVVPVRGIRRAVAEKMVTSRREIPDASSWVECDATELLEARAVIDARAGDVRVTPLALVLRACTAGLAAFPRLNARYDTDREEIEERSAVHLGVAVQTDRGLLVPVIHDAHARSTVDLASELQRLADRARAGTLAPAELTGSTFTVSNYGAFGVDGGVAIINHPEVAIIGVGRIVPKPWVVDGEVVVRSVVQLSLSFDHRVMDGGDAGGFLRFVADCVEQPALLLGHC
jgi:pyruvate dehydrogenase E2 component (dihydrolipoamide acetyltransferase)